MNNYLSLLVTHRTEAINGQVIGFDMDQLAKLNDTQCIDVLHHGARKTVSANYVRGLIQTFGCWQVGSLHDYSRHRKA